MLHFKNKELIDIVLNDDNGVRVEKWKDVVGYEGHYMVSDFGRVKALKRIVNHGFSGYITMPERILSQKMRNKGIGRNDLIVNLALDGVHKMKLVHRLVAQSFIENPLNKLEVNHINGNPADNRLENLEWVTSSENQFHSYKFLNRKKPDNSKEKNPKFRYFINTDMGVFLSYEEMANYFDVTVGYMRTKHMINKAKKYNFIKTTK